MGKSAWKYGGGGKLEKEGNEKNEEEERKASTGTEKLESMRFIL